MNSENKLPAAGLAEVRIVAASPETARQVALALRRCFEGHEQRSYPTGEDSTGTRVNLTVDTTRVPAGSLPSGRSRPAVGDIRDPAEPHADEIRVTTSGFRSSPAPSSGRSSGRTEIAGS